MKFGYRRDPASTKDRDFTTGLRPKLKALATGDVDLSRYATDSNQRSLSSCAGNATADSVEIICALEEEVLAKVEGRAPRSPVQLSRLFVYSMARALMDDDGNGRGDIDRDEGTYIRLCFDVLSRFGICDEVLWPYDTSKVFVPPSIKAVRQAVGHRVKGYYRISETGSARLDAVKSALRANHPVVFGTSIDSAFTKSSGPEIVAPPDPATVIGGHAMIIVGYVDGKFKVKNSWGPKWRGDGYCLFTPEYVTWSETRDLWVPTMGTKF